MRFFFRSRQIIYFLLFGVSVITISPSYAQSFNQTRAMDFGRIALTTYDQVGTLTLDPDGSYTASSEIVVIDAPVPARFEGGGFPANTAATLVVTDGNATLGGGGTGQIFTVKDYVSSPSTLVSNGAGDLIFDLGATLRSEGDGNSYTDGDYSADITVSVVF